MSDYGIITFLIFVSPLIQCGLLIAFVGVAPWLTIEAAKRIQGWIYQRRIDELTALSIEKNLSIRGRIWSSAVNRNTRKEVI